jgi:outer membrane protease
MNRTLLLLLFTTATSLGGVADKNAAMVQVETKEPKTTLSLGLGYFQATADEIVYGGSAAGGELSHLIWKTEDALTLEASVRYSLSARLDVYAHFTTALVDQGDMTNYDWLGSGTRWTDRSLHGDTELDSYYRLDAGLELAVLERGSLAISALGGFRYIDISWTARGGSFVYSTDPDGGLFRDDRGSFPSGEMGISYRQKIPGLYLGPQAEWTSGRVKVKAAVLGGVTVGATDRDYHWMRNIRFDGEFDAQVFFEASVALKYQLTRSWSYFLEGRYEQYELMKGSLQITELSSGETEFFSGDPAGARFGSWQIRTGLELRF